MNVIGGERDFSSIFRTGSRDGVWFVTKNNAFYGDYLSRDQALRGACLAAQGVESAGGKARVFTDPGDKLVAHRDFNFNR